MRILLDTSTLVAALVETHPNHTLAFPWLQKAKSKTFAGFVATHSIAELYNILTTLPIRPRISSATASRLLKRDVLDQLEAISLSKEDYAIVIEHLSGLGIIGGAIYDALIVRAAIKANVDQIVTFNADDFRRVYPALAEKIVSPQP
jgi:predicted nucleic acid-binding protein